MQYFKMILKLPLSFTVLLSLKFVLQISTCYWKSLAVLGNAKGHYQKNPVKYCKFLKGVDFYSLVEAEISSASRLESSNVSD